MKLKIFQLLFLTSIFLYTATCINAQDTKTPQKLVKTFDQSKIFKSQRGKLTKEERLKIYQKILADPKASKAQKAKARIALKSINN